MIRLRCLQQWHHRVVYHNVCVFCTRNRRHDSTNYICSFNLILCYALRLPHIPKKWIGFKSGEDGTAYITYMTQVCIAHFTFDTMWTDTLFISDTNYFSECINLLPGPNVENPPPEYYYDMQSKAPKSNNDFGKPKKSGRSLYKK